MKKKDKACKPTSILLGELKAPLQAKAMELDRSLNWLINSMLKEHRFLADVKKEKQTA